MHIINKLLIFCTLLGFLGGCTGTTGNWHSDDTPPATSGPAHLQYGSYSFGLYGTPDSENKIAVLLPLSGENGTIGKSIAPGIEAAFLQYAPSSTTITFYDTGIGTPDQVINTAIESNPNIIIGPVFADNARTLRNNKPNQIPALAFTSDITAVGDGVFSMSLMPTDTIESIVSEMGRAGASRFIIIAPNSESGRIMAGTAKSITPRYNLYNVGVFYYTPRDTESIKSTSVNASMFTARNAANTRAKEILANILNHEQLTAQERSSISHQLERIGKKDTIGNLPYDSILFLGDGEDTKSLASFLRYYDVGVRDAKFFGTPLWAESGIESDITMTGAVFTTLPDINATFQETYKMATNNDANRMAAIGYDATMLAIGAIYSGRPIMEYITDANGYIGTSGAFRLRQNGSAQRALQTIRANGDGTTTVLLPASETFINMINTVPPSYIAPAEEMQLETPGINPMDYIRIPEHLRSKYRSKTYGVSFTPQTNNELSAATVLPINQDSFSITAQDYKPSTKESINRTYIDSVEISE